MDYWLARLDRGDQGVQDKWRPSHGESRGSSPLGSANKINCLYRIGQLAPFPSPIFLQINRRFERPTSAFGVQQRFTLHQTTLRTVAPALRFLIGEPRVDSCALLKGSCLPPLRGGLVADLAAPTFELPTVVERVLLHELFG